MAQPEIMRLRRRAARLAGHADYGHIHIDGIDPNRPHLVRVWTTVGRGERFEAVAWGAGPGSSSPLASALQGLVAQLEDRRTARRPKVEATQ